LLAYGSIGSKYQLSATPEFFSGKIDSFWSFVRVGWAAEASADYQRLQSWPAGIDIFFLFVVPSALLCVICNVKDAPGLT